MTIKFNDTGAGELLVVGFFPSIFVFEKEELNDESY